MATTKIFKLGLDGVIPAVTIGAVCPSLPGPETDLPMSVLLNKIGGRVIPNELKIVFDEYSSTVVEVIKQKTLLKTADTALIPPTVMTINSFHIAGDYSVMEMLHLFDAIRKTYNCKINTKWLATPSDNNISVFQSSTRSFWIPNCSDDLTGNTRQWKNACARLGKVGLIVSNLETYDVIPFTLETLAAGGSAILLIPVMISYYAYIFIKCFTSVSIVCVHDNVYLIGMNYLKNIPKKILNGILTLPALTLLSLAEVESVDFGKYFSLMEEVSNHVYEVRAMAS